MYDVQMNAKVIEKALAFYRDNYKGKDMGSTMWEQRRAQEELDKLKKTVTALDVKGGGWLATTRHWIQCNAMNGDSVTWGGHEPLQFRRPLTASSFELLARSIAVTAVNEYKGLPT